MSRIVDLIILGGIACFIYAVIVKIIGKDLFIGSNAQPQPANYLLLALVLLVMAVAIVLVQVRDRLK
jgi:hypothetical protein